MKQPFKATHIIIRKHCRIKVMLVDGSAYTRSEWETGSTADWEYTDSIGLIFQGHPPVGLWFFDDIPAA